MKKLVVAVLLMLVCTAAFAQVSVGIGPEFNMNSRKNFAGGGVFSFDYGFAEKFAAGVNFTASHNFDEIMTLEPAALFRWYILSKNYAGLFLQANVGVSIIFEDDDTETLFMGGLRGGYRLPLGETFYIEPYGRVGYPFAFGVGVLAGVKF